MSSPLMAECRGVISEWDDTTSRRFLPPGVRASKVDSALVTLNVT